MQLIFEGYINTYEGKQKILYQIIKALEPGDSFYNTYVEIGGGYKIDYVMFHANGTYDRHYKGGNIGKNHERILCQQVVG